MAISFGQLGNLSLSVFKHLQDNLVASGIGSNNISGTFIYGHPSDDSFKAVRFPDEFIAGTANVIDHIGMPVIVFGEATLVIDSSFQLGSTEEQNNQTSVISIYAVSELQKRQLVNQIRFALRQKSISLLDFDENYSSPAVIGTVKVSPQIRVLPVRSTGQSDSRVNDFKVDMLITVSDK